ncbi:hypothetical protein P43SY_000442 [Pythium insidiosum]|uniref:Cilia- and flagella-associated protein 91 n=1 Tax=Pythium insidiosum TaxID=114742 RepID=A0AAD5LKY4_PYTIN|nr:hypothetical protein P43SY_000442 [Pythium insidiosum]
MVPSRPLDAVYDSIYTVSRSSGPFRKSAALRAAFAAASNNQKSRTGSANQAPPGYGAISGAHRVKYHQRPVLPHLHAEPPEVLLAPTAPPASLGAKKRSQDDDDASPTRSVGVQTMYRDSEAQTDPYSPDYTIKQSLTGKQESPEVLTLLHLHHQKGLPAGPAEIEVIERNRKKKAFEASLPPMTDEASFLLRKAMMETQETREWAYREAEIDALHEQRVELLRNALQERDKENEFLAEQRLEVLRQRLLHEKENTMERIQQERVTALRKLTKKRQHGHATSPRRDLRRDIIAEYADFGSKVYAPVTRGGKAGKVEIRELGIEREQYQQLDVLQEFETVIPSKMLVPSKLKPPSKAVRTAKDRKEAAIAAHLLKMESIIKKNKERGDADSPGGVGTAPSSPSTLLSRKRAQQQQQQLLMTRPPTPDYSLQRDDADDAMEDAVRLLQQLLRGRAVQNMMFDGRERRAELIQELRASDEAAAEAAKAAHNAGAELDEEETRVAASTMRKAEGEVISEMLDVLYKELDRAREIAKQRTFVDEAAEQRRRREVEEGGRRQAEDLVREREDEVFRHVERVHQETAMDWIDDLLQDVVKEQAHVAAMGELQVHSAAVGPMVLALERAGDSDEVVVKELVASLLLPQVQRQQLQHQVAQEERKYVTAVHALLTEATKTKQQKDDGTRTQ